MVHLIQILEPTLQKAFLGIIPVNVAVRQIEKIAIEFNVKTGSKIRVIKTPNKILLQEKNKTMLVIDFENKRLDL